MTSIILRALNPLFLALIALIGIAIQTSLFNLWPLNYVEPDFILLLILWCALRRNFIEGGILTLIFGHFSEIHSASPSGLLLLSYMLIYLAVKGLAQLLVIPDLASYVVLTLLTSVTFKLVNTTLLQMLAPTLTPWKNTLVLLFPGAAVAGLLSIGVFPQLEKLDLITCKRMKAEESLEPDLRLDPQQE